MFEGAPSVVCLVSAPGILSWKLCCIVGVMDGGMAAISVRLCLAKIRNTLKSSYLSHPPTVIPTGFVFCVLHGLKSYQLCTKLPHYCPAVLPVLRQNSSLLLLWTEALINSKPEQGEAECSGFTLADWMKKSLPADLANSSWLVLSCVCSSLPSSTPVSCDSSRGFSLLFKIRLVQYMSHFWWIFVINIEFLWIILLSC